MRALLIAVLTLTSATGACGEGVDQSPRPSALAIAGLPSTDHTWSAQEFQVAVHALTGLPAGHLPHLSDPDAATLFNRLTEPNALTYYSDSGTPLNVRMADCYQLLDASGQLLRLYAVAQQTDLSYSDEAIHVMGFTLRSSATMISLTEEFIPTLDATDPTYPTRMQGLEQVRGGAIGIVQGALTSLTTDRRVYDNASAAAFARILAETYPTLSRNFPANTKQRFEQTLATIARQDPSSDVRVALSAYAIGPT